MTTSTVHPVDEKLPTGRLAALGLQHVLVMYAGAIAVPLIVGRALKLSPEQVALLISADLFVCGIVTLIQSLGMTRWFGIKLPVMMGVTFAAVGPMVAMANAMPGVDGARAIFGAIIGAGIISMLHCAHRGQAAALLSAGGHRHHHRHHRHQPDARRRGLGHGRPAFPGAAYRCAQAGGHGRRRQGHPRRPPPAMPRGPAPARAHPHGRQPQLRRTGQHGHRRLRAGVILLLVKYGGGFVANISVLLGIIAGCVVAVAMGKMSFDKVAKAHWFDVVLPFEIATPTFDPILILTMTLVMIVVMIESTGMFLALSDITGKKLGRSALSAGLRTDGLGTLIGGIFNTFPYTSFSQNVGLVGVTGVKSRCVCVAGGMIMLVLGMLPKMAAFVESIPTFVLGGAGLVMFGMVAATGIRILSTVDYKGNRNNLYIVAMSIGSGLIPLVAPRWTQNMAHSLHPLLESGILLTAVAAVVLNIFFNGAQGRRSQVHRSCQGRRGALTRSVRRHGRCAAALRIARTRPCRIAARRPIRAASSLLVAKRAAVSPAATTTPHRTRRPTSR